MKKDKEWLKREIYAEYNDSDFIQEVWDLIDQLDEPQKTVIPQFVADYIELNKGWSEDRQEYIEDDSSGLWFALNGNSHGMPNSVSDWLFNEEKVETFAKAWIDGYEVEKEKLYHVVNKENYFMLRKYDGLVDTMQLSPTMSRDEFGKDTRFMLTEKEIKDYDERFWAFAEPV